MALRVILDQEVQICDVPLDLLAVLILLAHRGVVVLTESFVDCMRVVGTRTCIRALPGVGNLQTAASVSLKGILQEFEFGFQRGQDVGILAGIRIDSLQVVE